MAAASGAAVHEDSVVESPTGRKVPDAKNVERRCPT
jgi:hypothetical protein